jgi:succinate-acetate transporter protein
MNDDVKKIQIDMGDPGVMGLCAFGFVLFILGYELTVTKAVAGAALYAVFYAGICEFIAGLMLITKGQTYVGTVMGVFGAWLLGYFLLMTQGKAIGVYNAPSVAMYVLALEFPLVFLAIPAFKSKNIPLSLAFFAIGVLVIALGAGVALGNHTLVFTAGVASFASCAFIWYIAVDHILHPH